MDKIGHNAQTVGFLLLSPIRCLFCSLCLLLLHKNLNKQTLRTAVLCIVFFIYMSPSSEKCLKKHQRPFFISGFLRTLQRFKSSVQNQRRADKHTTPHRSKASDLKHIELRVQIQMNVLIKPGPAVPQQKHTSNITINYWLENIKEISDLWNVINYWLSTAP